MAAIKVMNTKKSIYEKSKDICKMTVLFFESRLSLGTVVFLSEIFTRH